jgi:hypothetical protein
MTPSDPVAEEVAEAEKGPMLTLMLNHGKNNNEIASSDARPPRASPLA